MEKSLNEYIRRLIDLDKTAVSLKERRNAELQELSAKSRNELKRIDSELKKAAKEAKQKHDEIIEAAKRQVKEIDDAAAVSITELEKSFSGIREKAAADIWNQLINDTH